jgi:catalase
LGDLNSQAVVARNVCDRVEKTVEHLLSQVLKDRGKTRQGVKNMTGEESANLIGIDRESHQRDLFEVIARGEYPSWTVKVQIMTEEQAKTFQWNPFDLTKVWPYSNYPLIEIGTLELNCNPENYRRTVPRKRSQER